MHSIHKAMLNYQELPPLYKTIYHDEADTSSMITNNDTSKYQTKLQEYYKE